MSYTESQLQKNEQIVKLAEKNWLYLLGTWLKGILFFWLLFIPLVKAIKDTISFAKLELALTNRRVIGKVGVFNTKAMDAPLNKVQNISVSQKLMGKIFNYGVVRIDTAAGMFLFPAIKNADAFKNMVLSQADEFEEERIRMQATETAKAMAGVLNK